MRIFEADIGLCPINKLQNDCHSRAGGSPVQPKVAWIPACQTVSQFKKSLKFGLSCRPLIKSGMTDPASSNVIL
jgi:hypothetical protein